MEEMSPVRELKQNNLNKTPSGCKAMAEDQKGTYSTIKSTILGKFSNIKGLTKVIPTLLCT